MKLYYFETIQDKTDYNYGYILDTGYGFTDLEVGSTYNTLNEAKQSLVFGKFDDYGILVELICDKKLEVAFWDDHREKMEYYVWDWVNRKECY